MNRKTKNIKNASIKIKALQHGRLLKTLFIKNILKNGKIYLAMDIVNKSLFLLEHTFKKNYLKILEKAVANAKIEFDLKPITSQTLKFKTPIEIDSYRAIRLGIKNIISLTQKKSKNSLSEKLFSAIVETYYKRGAAVQKHNENLQIAQKYKKNYEDVE